MKTFSLILLITLALPSAAACEPPQGTSRTAEAKEELSLEELKWDKRVVILFASGPRERDYQKQQEALTEAKEGMEERDIIVVAAFADGSGMVDGRPLDQRSVRAVRRDFQPAPNAYTFVLIGKDGTEKMRVIGEPASTEKIFETIDAMPMRRGEMRQEDAAGK